ncbi:MAG: shikimate kinase, partial [Chloroflexi bacterium OLB14]
LVYFLLMNNIFLYGPSGTGKSTIGKIIAENLKLPFIDLDKAIENKAGKSISEIIESQGESAFRDLESIILKESVGHALSVTHVIALGGGALLREENKNFAQANGKILLLMAELNTLIERLKSSNNRPLLAGDLETKLTAMLEKRKEHYDSFPLKVYVDNKTTQQNALQAQIALGRHRLSSMGEYDVIVGDILELANLLANLQEQAPALHNSIIVTDENIAKLHAETIKN